MNILFIGDVVGHPGRQAIRQLLPSLLEAHAIQFVIANVENAAGGFGVTPDVADELFALGADVLTSGNHIWDKREIEPYIAVNPYLLRPANYPPMTPGRGSVVATARDGTRVGVVNIMGRIFMGPWDNPFLVVDQELEKVRAEVRVIVVDVHAEATSEKQAMGWYLDGRCTAALGSHTHVQTADEKILPGGTAYITDVGMTGPYDSVIGIKKEGAIERFITCMPHRYETAKGMVILHAVLVDADPHSGKARSITRLQVPM